MLFAYELCCKNGVRGGSINAVVYAVLRGGIVRHARLVNCVLREWRRAHCEELPRAPREDLWRQFDKENIFWREVHFYQSSNRLEAFLVQTTISSDKYLPSGWKSPSSRGSCWGNSGSTSRTVVRPGSCDVTRNLGTRPRRRWRSLHPPRPGELNSVGSDASCRYLSRILNPGLSRKAICEHYERHREK